MLLAPPYGLHTWM